MSPKYRYMVDAQSPGHLKLYDGTDVADAMAAFSKSISDGVEYVTLEALRELPPLTPREDPK